MKKKHSIWNYFNLVPKFLILYTYINKLFNALVDYEPDHGNCSLEELLISFKYCSRRTRSFHVVKWQLTITTRLTNVKLLNGGFLPIFSSTCKYLCRSRMKRRRLNWCDMHSSTLSQSARAYTCKIVCCLASGKLWQIRFSITWTS